ARRRGTPQPRVLRSQRGLQSLRLRRPLLHLPRRRMVLRPEPPWAVGFPRDRAGTQAGRRRADDLLQGPAGPRQEDGASGGAGRSGCVRGFLPSGTGEEGTLLARPLVLLRGLLVQLGAPARCRRNLHVTVRDLGQRREQLVAIRRL